MINMKRFLTTLVLLFTLNPATALADGCEDLWFTRNLIMDRAGYCFGSDLGRAMFDNSDCIGKAVSLSPIAAAQVAEVRALEQQHDCKVNTAATSLDLDDLDIRRKLHILPIRDEFESACLGWQQGVTALHAGRDSHSPVIGRITDGDNVSFAHVPVGDWSYVTVTGPDWGPPTSGGWLGAETSQKSCRAWAG